MNIYYNKKYNINLGLFAYLHPFDGKKFKQVFNEIKNLDSISIKSPAKPIAKEEINNFVDASLERWLPQKKYILQALEVPSLPLIPYSFIDNRILSPMRWGVAGTLAASRDALQGNRCWNMAGGYHHASRASSEGFCIYNDIGITVDILMREKVLDPNSRILIIDIDAHHGNGNALTFMNSKNVTILDIYNNNVYPTTANTKARVNIKLPLPIGTNADFYLSKLNDGLAQLKEAFDIAFVVAGTDVVSSDPLGGLNLTVKDCIERDVLVMNKLLAISTPCVFLGGGGYSKDSAQAIIGSLKVLYKL